VNRIFVSWEIGAIKQSPQGKNSHCLRGRRRLEAPSMSTLKRDRCRHQLVASSADDLEKNIRYAGAARCSMFNKLPADPGIVKFRNLFMIKPPINHKYLEI